ncbi:DUF3396 domain-containing protein [Shimwellia blattae]|uniref:DUF3396 domain-containing protein n=1 Tax=Shimwellia blattae (strain ATCC 29907 / DSM 4481 / JCM 1650 / NBRC 105725 / CDC 9005-74) TaxID=630626 RepID=I2B6Y9_SHIBC|nr:DUF3396 domain-containing protein [Shimwellia blattae]AFJ46293.1 hypothetical protein EBL_c11890 [Shimwellia blattae DSM 4481 = NBRC 105725]GAB83012.1 hypothetical protein EB105725_40_00140 [Shimwellia blattae DSM 4481 = NBRC 105725]VDY63759.1 Uncharacterized protein conserved in bacteria [Shimwellia blattae]VEC21900.1 Uncharacterized protein conserved in bacteria [Shimwellia blattae]
MKLNDVDLNYIEQWLPEASVKYKDGSQAVNLGLIITVFFKDGHLPEVRQKMVECVDRYYAEFKSGLKKTVYGNKWVGITGNNYQKKRQQLLALSEEETASWYLGSVEKDYEAPDYSILVMNTRIFHNENDRSVIKLTFPLSLLKEPDGNTHYQAWIMWLCESFAVESGYAGLSFVLPYEFHRMFPYEYKLAQRFPGVMVDSLGTLEGGEAVEGLKGPCWYTILGNPWLEKLGGAEKLAHRLNNTSEIELLPYNGGLILKAGVLPPGLGETKTEELPPLLVKVNQLIKPIRYDGHNGLHFYCEYENFQFEEASSMAWFARFDEASAVLDKEDEGKSWDPVRITCWSGEKSPFDGRWATIINGETRYTQTRAGQIMPEFEDKHGQKHPARWSLLERDDGGSVFAVTPDEES